jgi:LuxR family maltose regulon positive regulatory protein
MSAFDDRYDFDTYYAKMDNYLTKSTIKPDWFHSMQLGPWLSGVSGARSGAPQEYIQSGNRLVKHMTHCLNGVTSGADILCQGEFFFYQGRIQEAEQLIIRAVEQAREFKQYDVIHRGLFYIMRIAVSQGDYAKAKKALSDIEGQLHIKEYQTRFVTFDIAKGWLYYALLQPEEISSWLKETFAPYAHTSFIANYGNLIKARYCYLTRNYIPLLNYIDEMKQRESILYGRIEMLAIKACAHYKMKDRDKAFAALRVAYEEATPNDILMPFIEMGKDMRTLTNSFMLNPNYGIPQQWLKNINIRSAAYAKYQSLFISEHRITNDIGGGIILSPRESDILTSLYNGLSRTEIAADYSLSVNTVDLVISSIYKKLNADSLINAIRIAVKRNLL